VSLSFVGWLGLIIHAANIEIPTKIRAKIKNTNITPKLDNIKNFLIIYFLKEFIFL
jgi:hypothetical protein